MMDRLTRRARMVVVWMVGFSAISASGQVARAGMVSLDLPGLTGAFGGVVFPSFRETYFDLGIEFVEIDSAVLRVSGETGFPFELAFTGSIDGEPFLPPVETRLIQFVVDVPLPITQSILDGFGTVGLKTEAPNCFGCVDVIDSVTLLVEGTPVPEPVTLVLLVGAVTPCLLRRAT